MNLQSKGKRATSVINTSRKLENGENAEDKKETKFRREDKILGAILWTIVKPRFLRFSLYWMRKCSKQDKKGLRIIGWIYKHEGEK